MGHFSRPRAEPPTLFEYLGLDATKPPFWPPSGCTSPTSVHNQAAIQAILNVYKGRLAAFQDNHPDYSQHHAFGLMNAVAGCLLNDTMRTEYLAVFVPALVGQSFEVDINNAVGRRGVIDSVCVI